MDQTSIIEFVTWTLLICVTNGFQKQYVPDSSGSIPPVKTAATGVTKFQPRPGEHALYYQVIVANIDVITGPHIHSW
ncbi:MAG TPA: CHRD domain-containing protein [Candidatus Bathyarchaeia archaeon]|nr:CHRD domain-containing protein [Candidatus Bathyarchaeia archaeon]